MPDSIHPTLARALRQSKRLNNFFSTPFPDPRADPPPLMKAAFRRNAQARQGWQLMPQPLRRQYVIAIFRSRYPETRARYLKRALLESARYA